MMTLKEAFRYQNFIKQMMRSAELFLYEPKNLLTVTKLHKMHDVNAEVEDKEEVIKPDTIYTAQDVIDFVVSLVEERIALTKAINCAKAEASEDLDALIEGNKLRQFAVTLLRRVATRGKAYEEKSHGTSYKFNVEGNQSQYYYDIEESGEPTFDVDGVAKMICGMSTDAEQVSVEADALRINTRVNFDPKYNVTLTFDELMTKLATPKAE